MAFGMSGQQVVSDLRKVEMDTGHELGLSATKENSRKVTEYQQFEADLRMQAARMSEIYEVFFCLENSIRRLVRDAMVEIEGPNWWGSVRVDENRIRKEAEQRRQKEIDSGITPRSEDMIDYTTFGELSQLITDNWDVFDAIFVSKRAVSNVTNQLNLLRGPIAHCNDTDDLEQERLNLAVRSWFKIMS
ncbi:Swt1 family HEPN domain-containing protein [Parasedimentitalea marina]|nr:Swt1 family HEPN domain-containing protein [Parasedimentitalea marina]